MTNDSISSLRSQLDGAAKTGQPRDDASERLFDRDHHPTLTCAVQRRDFPVGDRPTRQLSLRPVAIGAVVEVTKRLKPLV